MVESACYSSCARHAARAGTAQCLPLTTTGWYRQHGVGGVSRASRYHDDKRGHDIGFRVAEHPTTTSGFLSDLRSAAGAQPGSRFRFFSRLRRYGKVCRSATFTSRSNRDTDLPHSGMRCGSGALGSPQENPGVLQLSHSGPGTSGDRRSIYPNPEQDRNSLGSTMCDRECARTRVNNRKKIQGTLLQ